MTHDALYSRDTFTLIECSCSLVYLSPLPTERDFATMHVDSTQFDSSVYTGEQRVADVMGYIGGCLRSIVDERHLHGQPLRVLEVGAGLAWMSRAAKKLNLVCETVAQDITPEGRNLCPWVDRYIVAPTETLRPDDIGRFDLISATHTFEHVPYPVEFLTHLNSLLKPGGKIFLTMPHRPRRWNGGIQQWLGYSYNHVPGHLQYFSRSSMQMVAEKAGLAITHFDASQEKGEAMEVRLAKPPFAAPANFTSPAVNARAVEFRDAFVGSKPFKHVMIDDFLDAGFAEDLLLDFPAFDPERAKNEFGEVGRKAVHEKIEEISPAYARLSDYVKSTGFLQLMSDITGIPDLLPDPKFFGGGTHENLHGQELDPHVDFNYDPPTKLHRRLNLLIYLNKEWHDEWGGAIELHSNPRKPEVNEIKSFSPLFNRAVIFETNEYSWHGFPKINLPADKQHLSRKSISIYLYTRTRPAGEAVPEHGTFYVQRPLPAHLRPGHMLTQMDIDDINDLLKRRDDWLAHYHKIEIAVSGQIGELRHRLNSRSLFVQVRNLFDGL